MSIYERRILCDRPQIVSQATC